MASHVQVILTQSVDNLGVVGELVRVRPGYARNYLLPRSLAVVATKGQVKRVQHERRAALARAATMRKDAEARATSLNEVTVEISKPAGEGDRMYGSVTPKEVVAALAKQGIEVDRRKLSLSGAIKQLGEYEVGVKLSPDVSTTFKLVVSREDERA